MKIKALKAFTVRDSSTGALTSIAHGAVAEVDSTLGTELINKGLAEAYTLVSPTGLYSITGLGTFDVTNYASAVVTNADYINLIERDITSLVIPSAVTAIGQSAFNGCTALEEITIPTSVTSIGQYAFSGCTALETVVIPDEVTTIGQYAFSANTSLASADIGTGVSAIPASMFTGCTALASLTVRATTPPTLGTGALTNVPATCAIYVPSDSVDAYKSATGWSDRASYIQAITEE